METSILKSIKKLLGIAPEYTEFDQDIVMHINSVFMTLSQLGIGPATGFMIEDDSTTWAVFLGSDFNLASVKSYMYLKVRLLFDPPATGPAQAAFEKQIEQYEWRLNVHRETTQWRNPLPRLPSESPTGDPIVIDGGTG